MQLWFDFAWHSPKKLAGWDMALTCWNPKLCLPWLSYSCVIAQSGQHDWCELGRPGNLMLPRHSAFHFMAGVKISLRCAINATQASQARVRSCTAERVAFGTVVHFGPLGQLGGRVEWKFTLAQRPLVPVKHCHRAALCRLSPQQHRLRH